MKKGSKMKTRKWFRVVRKTDNSGRRTSLRSHRERSASFKKLPLSEVIG